MQRCAHEQLGAGVAFTELRKRVAQVRSSAARKLACVARFNWCCFSWRPKAGVGAELLGATVTASLVARVVARVLDGPTDVSFGDARFFSDDGDDNMGVGLGMGVGVGSRGEKGIGEGRSKLCSSIFRF